MEASKDPSFNSPNEIVFPLLNIDVDDLLPPPEKSDEISNRMRVSSSWQTFEAAMVFAGAANGDKEPILAKTDLMGHHPLSGSGPTTFSKSTNGKKSFTLLKNTGMDCNLAIA